MSDQALTTSKPSRQAVAGKTASRPGRVTGKLAVACKAIAWEGKELDQAARDAELTTRTLRLALERRHVIAYLKEQREVFRAYIASQNIHHAAAMRNTSRNEMARLGAMKFIEGSDSDALVSAGGSQRLPGVVIIISAGSNEPQPKVIEHTIRGGDVE